MTHRIDRRAFLRALGAASAASWATGPLALAGNEKDIDEDKNFLEPEGLTGKPLDLPMWTHGTTSASTDSVLMFRGNPAHTFYGTGPVSESPTLQWSQTLATFHTVLRGRKKTWTGTGWSGQPVAYGDYVFVGGQGGYVYAFEQKTGEVRWRLAAKRMYKSSACFYDQHIYIGNTDDHFRCVDAATGRLRWKVDTGTDCDSSAVVVDNKVYVAGESGFLRCLHPKTGKHHWKTDIGGTGEGTRPGSNGSETSPAVADGEVYAATYDGFLHCVDAKSGEIKWKAATGDDTDGSAAILGDRVYIAAEEKSPYLYCFDRSKKGKEVWSFKNTGGWWATPAIVGDHIYMGGNDAHMYCLDARSGKEIWSRKMPQVIWSSAAVVDGKVIFGCSDGHMYMLEAKTGKPIWKGDMGGMTLSTPIVVNGRIYLGSNTGDFKCFA